MTSLFIKNVPEELVQRLRARAKQHHRSLQGELLSILEEAVEPRHLTVLEAFREVQGLGFTTGDDVVSMVREDRNAR